MRGAADPRERTKLDIMITWRIFNIWYDMILIIINAYTDKIVDLLKYSKLFNPFGG